MNEESLINLFRDQAIAHTGVNWFEAGIPQSFDSDAMQDLEVPLLYVQTISASELDQRTTYQFTLYCFDQPRPAIDVDHSANDDAALAFQWDAGDVSSRDACKDTLRDIICEIKVRNAQTMTITNTGNLVGDNATIGNLVGWRITINISFDSPYNTTEFAN